MVSVAPPGPGPVTTAGSTTMPSRHRADIDVLRALAIVSVVAYHYRPEAMPGGFVGVDVFFVISGFLITSHLRRELFATGALSLRRFWSRRIRRLMPASLTVVASVAVVSPFVLPSLLRDGTAVQQVSSLLLIQNWTLAFQSVDYLAAGADPTALEHFWSLSMEEQFYLLWPLVLLAVAAIGRRTGHLGLALAVASAGLAVASFAFCLLLAQGAAAVAYLNTGARAWEFLVGGLVCLIPDTGGLVRPVLRIAGAAALTASLLVIDASDDFPGWITLLPVAGTALVIAAGAPRPGDHRWRLGEDRVTRYLASRSYTLYLWHWPVYVLLPAAVALVTGVEQPPTPGAAVLVGGITLSVLLAELTHRSVETRFWTPSGRTA